MNLQLCVSENKKMIQKAPKNMSVRYSSSDVDDDCDNDNDNSGGVNARRTQYYALAHRRAHKQGRALPINENRYSGPWRMR